jgi:RNA polymerase sigma factor (TIGR02999 family)
LLLLAVAETQVYRDERAYGHGHYSISSRAFWCFRIQRTAMCVRENDNNLDCAAVITRLLSEASAGDPRAPAGLLPLVYDQLRRLASQKLRAERSDHTLQATALVHEAYLRLVGESSNSDWDSRWHFFAAAAEAMRRILVESARRRGRVKRGGGRERVSLDEANNLTIDEPPHGLLAVDDALTALSSLHPREAELVKLRFFAGLTIEQASQALGISVATANREWAFARAWLYREIGDGANPRA